MILGFNGHAWAKDRVMISEAARVFSQLVGLRFLIRDRLAAGHWQGIIDLPLKFVDFILGPLVKLELLVMQHIWIQKLL